ncbi:MAG: hypothetical protein JNL80_02125 [Phycisphaerae bacterium]|jgi:hypothetical protein|nr:hypothetical protein [Phycisphaerae bacterium]
MRRTDAAPNVIPAISSSHVPAAGPHSALTARALRWDSDAADVSSPLEALGRHLNDLATIAAAIHRSRVASAMRSSGTHGVRS